MRDAGFSASVFRVLLGRAWKRTLEHGNAGGHVLDSYT
jgi:hypothetical protein